MTRTRVALTVVIVLIGVLAGANFASAAPPPQQPGQQCSGGAYPLFVNILGDPFAEVVNAAGDCPTAGTSADPTVRREKVLDVPAGPLVYAAVLEGRSEFASDHSTSSARAVGVELLGTLGIDVVRAIATSSCSPGGVATQTLDAGQVTITNTQGTPTDPTDDTIVFNGIAPPNTEIPLDPLINIKLNEQTKSLSPGTPGTFHNKHAEGSVNSVHVQVLTSPTGPPAIDVIVGHAESDITCKEHAFTIDAEPETQSKDTGTTATVTATVRNEDGIAVPFVPVSWSTAGVGSLVSIDTETNALGQATAQATSPDVGTQNVTASLDPATTVCANVGGVCSDTVDVVWTGGPPPPPPASTITYSGHAHTDYDGDGQVHLSKNDYGDVHIGGNITNNLVTGTITGVLGYWDLRDNPPGLMEHPFRCERFTVTSMVVNGGASTVTFDGTVGRCNKNQNDPDFTTFHMVVHDGGNNPPNQDSYHVQFFGPFGRDVYDWADNTTVGLGDLSITIV